MNKFDRKIREEYLLYLGSNTILHFIHNFTLYAQRLERDCKSIDQKKNTPANRQELVRIKKHLEKLEELFHQARCKPLLAKYRGKNWILPKSNTRARCLTNQCFLLSEIVAADKCCSISKKSEINVYKMGLFRYEYYPLNSPLVVQEWEYEYLKKHPDFAKDWIEASSADEKTVKDFLTALDY